MKNVIVLFIIIMLIPVSLYFISCDLFMSPNAGSSFYETIIVFVIHDQYNGWKDEVTVDAGGGIRLHRRKGGKTVRCDNLVYDYRATREFRIF
jgi:hypothetical protein